MLEWWILGSAWVMTVVLFWRGVPREKRRDAWVIAMFQQFVTWGTGLLTVEMRWIEYPVRCFPDASRTSFTFEFLVYPVLSALFNLRFPKQPTPLRVLLCYAAYTGGLTLAEVLLEANTDLIEYKGWAWYWSFATIWFTFYLSRRYYLWYQKGLQPVRAGAQDGT